MSTVSDQYRQARETQHLTIQQVADLTKMRSDHVRAFEEGNFGVFSAPVYLRGFARTYAKLLKLDAAQLLAALDRELTGTTRSNEPPPLAEPPRGAVDFLMLQLSKVNQHALRILVVAAIGIAALAVTMLLLRSAKTSNPLAGFKPNIYQPAQTNAGDTLALPVQKR